MKMKMIMNDENGKRARSFHWEFRPCEIVFGKGSFCMHVLFGLFDDDDNMTSQKLYRNSKAIYSNVTNYKCSSETANDII